MDEAGSASLNQRLDDSMVFLKCMKKKEKGERSEWEEKQQTELRAKTHALKGQKSGRFTGLTSEEQHNVSPTCC